MKKLLITILSLSLVSCTDNWKVRKLGGKEEVILKPNHIFLNATWKDETSLWITTKDTLTGEGHFYEKSAFGTIEGEIIFKPSK